ncbi:MAG TPA: hypothetical protein VLG14_17200 [Sphingomonas sp.]|nr:hypothetical protein [Sphingomonas sp.]
MLKFREPELLARLFDGEFELGLGGPDLLERARPSSFTPPHRLLRALLGAAKVERSVPSPDQSGSL